MFVNAAKELRESAGYHAIRYYEAGATIACRLKSDSHCFAQVPSTETVAHCEIEMAAGL